jgi:hypothetical protein
VRRSGAAGSESWIAAHQSLSRLESERGPTVEALAEIDAVGRERQQTSPGQAGADFDAIAGAAAQVREIAEAQSQAIARLSESLPSL